MPSFSGLLGLFLDGPVSLASSAVPDSYDCPNWPTSELAEWMFSFENTPFVTTAIVSLLVLVSHDIIVPCISIMILIDGMLINPLLLALFQQYGPQGEECEVYGYVMPEPITQRFAALAMIGVLIGLRQRAIPSFFTMLSLSGFTTLIFIQGVYRSKAYPHQVLAGTVAGALSAVIQLEIFTRLLLWVGDAIVGTFPLNWLFGYCNEYVKVPGSSFTEAIVHRATAKCDEPWAVD